MRQDMIDHSFMGVNTLQESIRDKSRTRLLSLLFIASTLLTPPNSQAAPQPAVKKPTKAATVSSARNRHSIGVSHTSKNQPKTSPASIHHRTTSEVHPQGTSPPEKRITGTFIQIGEADLADNASWEKHLDVIRSLGLKRIIIQYVDKPNFHLLAQQNDPVPFILSYCRRNGIEVLMGTYYENGFIDRYWNNDLSDFQENSRVFNATRDAAKNAATKYNLAEEPCFKGWYLSLEPFLISLSQEKQVAFNQFLKRCVAELPARRPNDIVATSVFLPDTAARDDYSSNIAELIPVIKDSGVNVLMLQDGVGKLNGMRVDGMTAPLNLNTLQNLKNFIEPYMLAFMNLERSLPGVKLWLDLEIYDPDGAETKPPAVSQRVLNQLELETPFLRSNSEIIAWDVYNQMSKFNTNGGKQAKRTAFYNFYFNYVRNKYPAVVVPIEGVTP